MLMGGHDVKIETEIDLLRVIIEDAMWNVRYHEQSLFQTSKKRALAAALLARCDCKFTLEEAELFYNDEDTNEDDLISVDDYLKHCIGSLFAASDYHQSELRTANEVLATSKLLLARTNFTEISLAEIQTKVDARLRG